MTEKNYATYNSLMRHMRDKKHIRIGGSYDKNKLPASSRKNKSETASSHAISQCSQEKALIIQDCSWISELEMT